jgi:hypothetical protein
LFKHIPKKILKEISFPNLKLQTRVQILLENNFIVLYFPAKKRGGSNQVRRGDGLRVLAVELVRLEDGVAVPVAPVHPVLEQRDAERVLQHVRRIKNDPVEKQIVFFILLLS